MAAPAASPNTTPILDSGICPKARKKKLGAILFGLSLGVPFALALIRVANQASGSPAGDFIGVSYLLSFVAAIIVHELGHLLAGWMVGFHFSSFTIGPFSLFLEYGKLRFRIRRTLPAGGYAGMHIDRVRRLRHRLMIFSAAGPAANLVSAGITAACLAFVSSITPWSLAAELFWMLSAILGVANLFPFRLGALYPDGARMWMLLFSREKARRWLSLAGTGTQSQAGIRPRNYRRTWLDAAGRFHDESVDEFAANWTGYLAANDRKEASVAADRLERCLALAGLLGPTLRDTIALEACVFTAWFRGDADTARKWQTQVKRPKALPKLMRIRAEIAQSCARKEFANALAGWDDGYSFIEKLPQTPIKNRLRVGFLEWKAEIEERASKA